MLKEIFIKKISLLATYILAVLSLYKIGVEINSLTHNFILSLFTLFALLFIIALPFLIEHFYSPHVFSLFKLPPPASFIITDSSHEVNVDIDGNTSTVVTRNMVFLTKPKKWELVDTIFIHRGIRKEDFVWESEDAEEISRIWVNKDMLAIFWRQKGSMEFREKQAYTHKYSWNMAGCLKDPVNHWFIFPTVETGRHSFNIKTGKEIEKAVGFALPWRKRSLLKKDQISLYDYARKLKETGCPEPKIDKTKFGLSWVLENLVSNKIYTCVFYHENAYKWIDNLLK